MSMSKVLRLLSPTMVGSLGGFILSRNTTGLMRRMHHLAATMSSFKTVGMRREDASMSVCGGQKEVEGKTNEWEEQTQRFLKIMGFATGVLLTFWVKSRWSAVQAAKPIHDYNNQNQSGEGYRGQRGLGSGANAKNDGDIKSDRKSNREVYNFIADVVEKVTDTVVCIEVKDHSSVDFFTGLPHTASNGSGFIVNEDGLILTNAHVVDSQRHGSSFSVRLADGRTFAGRIEDIDYESDLALIRINANNLPTMPLGCSADTKIGEFVVAVGSPLTLTNTITSGIVSSTSRGASELGIQNGINYIQTDAAITFGNSGGPLINLDGEAIGINSMKVTAGISFAIPIDHAKKFLARAETRRLSGMKKPVRRYMGLTILTLTEQIKRELESRGYRKVNQGVLVWQVVVGSPAYLAGIQAGDIIVRINGKEIRSSSDLYEVVKSAAQLNIHVQRGDKLYSCVVAPESISED